MKQQTFIVTKVYGIGAFNSEGMKSDNPHSGIYEAETSRTIDLNGGSPACNQGGMAIVQCVEPGALSRGQGERVWDKCPTLRAKMGDNQPCVVLNDNIPAVTTYSFQRSDEFKETDKASTQSRRQYKDATDLIVNSTYALDRASFNQGKNAQYDFQISEDDKTQTVVSRGPNAVAEPPSYSVRRLTPLECERLQGFPDGWTDIPGQTEATQEELEFWREVWLTWDKLQAEEPEEVKPRNDKRLLKWLKNPVSDSAQYKALGNSVAVPCPEYVLEGIKEVLEVAHEK
jgi:DNA (cytosine-5)-methyltransferase 1